jgi:hypothetical protein
MSTLIEPLRDRRDPIIQLFYYAIFSLPGAPEDRGLLARECMAQESIRRREATPLDSTHPFCSDMTSI